MAIRPQDSVINDEVRQRVLDYSKSFKTSWIGLGQSLFAVWQDKFYKSWGYEKFEYYTEKEIGLNKNLCMKLLKSYAFIESDEPAYLKEEFIQERDAVNIPNYDAIDLLRMAKGKKELLKEDYRQLKKDLFEKGKDVQVVRKDLTAMIRERKAVDPEEEREQRSLASIKKALAALTAFKKDMEVLKLVPDDILAEAKEFIKKLEEQVK